MISIMHSSILLTLLAATATAMERAIHTVTVGGVAPSADASGSPTPMLVYNPESVKATVGDTVHFIFKSKNHTATQSTFDDPCVKMDNGADSGFMPNPNDEDGFTWDFEVTTEEPIWMYCKQKVGNHCGKGMVFAINSKDDTEKSFVAFKQLAIEKNGEVNEEAAPPDNTVAVDTDEKVMETKTCNSPASVTPSVVEGQGTDASGNACSCSCLCGAMPMAEGMGVGQFGGMGGMIPREPVAAAEKANSYSGDYY